MSQRFPVPLRFLLALASIFALAIPTAPAFSQSATTTTMISIDSPTDGATVTNGTQVNVGGWAADTAGPGTGVDMVRIYLDGRMDAGGTLAGNANYGGNRPDVGTALGSSNYISSGFDYLWTPSNLSSGTHQIYVYAHSIANGWAYKTVNVTVSGPPAASTPTRPMGPGAYGPGYGQGPTTPYGGTFLNNQYGYGGYPGGGCQGFYDYYANCGPGYGGFPPPPPPPNPCIGYGGGYGYGGGLGYQQTVTVFGPPSGTIILSWIAAPNVQSYRIYQANAASPLNFSVVQTISQTTGMLATNATVTGLAPGQTFYFQVRAVDPAGLETVVPASSLQGGGGYPGYGYGGCPGYPGQYPFPPGYPGSTLPAPTGVVVVGVTGTTATLQWTAVPGAVSYRVEQAIGNSGVFGPAVMSNSTTTSAVVTGLALSTAYQFRVIALDNFGNQSPPSVPVPATTTAGP
jgi:hypothetical protein